MNLKIWWRCEVGSVEEADAVPYGEELSPPAQIGVEAVAQLNGTIDPGTHALFVDLGGDASA